MAGAADRDGLRARRPGGSRGLAWIALAWLVYGVLPAVDAVTAAAAGDVDALRMALGQDPGAAQREDERGIPILQLAIAGHSEPCVKMLLEAGADPAATNMLGDAALHVAVQSGTPAIFKLVAARARDSNAVNLAGDTPLHLAIRLEDLAAVQVLLAKGADPNRAVQDKFETPLTLAIRFGRRDRNCRILRALLAAGADARRSPYKTESWTGDSATLVTPHWDPLDFVSANGSVEQLAVLLDTGLRIDSLRQPSLVGEALRAGRGEIAELLLRHHAPLPREETESGYLLHRATGMRLPGLVELLLAGGADAELQDRYDKRAIEYAADHHTAEVLAAAMGPSREAEFHRALADGNGFTARALQPYVRNLPAAVLPLFWLAGMSVAAGWLFRRHRREMQAARVAETEKKAGSNRQAAVPADAPTGAAPGATADPLVPAPVGAATVVAAAAGGDSARNRPNLSQWLRDKRQGTVEELFQRFAAPRKLIIGAGAAWFLSTPLYFSEPLLMAQSPWVASGAVLLGLGWLGLIAALLLLRAPQLRYRSGLVAGYLGLALAAGCAGWNTYWGAQLETVGARLPGWLAYAAAAVMLAMLPVLGFMLGTMHRTHALSAPRKVRPSLLTADDYEVPTGWDVGEEPKNK